MDKLLPGEKVKHMRTDIKENNVEGVLFVTNFRVIFLDPKEKVICNEFPNISIWKLKKGNKKENKKESSTVLHIQTKDGRMLKFKLASETHFKETYEQLAKYAYPPELNSLFAFTYKQYFIKEVGKGQDIRKYTNPDIYDPIREYQRIGIPCAGYRISTANQDYKLCPTYPSLLVVPEGITDEQLKSVAAFRSRGRIPAVVWRHPVHGSTISRCSQPSVGLKGNSCTEDIQLLSQLRNTNQQALYVLDSRPKTNALANSLKGGGYEKGSHYKDCHSVEFQNVENIHAVRNALLKLYKLCANKSPYNNKHWKSSLEESKWLEFVRSVLLSAVRMAEIVHTKGQSVLIHCSDGWDRTAQTCSVAQLLMDPFYRTIEGFLVLLEKEWLTFGHQFARRAGHGANITNPKDSQRSPIFLQFMDSVWQLLQQFPTAFEFNGTLLIALMDNLYSCQYGTFLLDCDRQRKHANITDHTISLWYHVLSSKAKYANKSYVAREDVLQPTINNLTVTLWTDYYLRWNPFTNDNKQVEELIKQRMLMRQVSLTELRASAKDVDGNDHRVRSESLAVPRHHSHKTPEVEKKKERKDKKKDKNRTDSNATEPTSSAPSTLRDEESKNDGVETTAKEAETTSSSKDSTPRPERKSKSKKDKDKKRVKSSKSNTQSPSPSSDSVAATETLPATTLDETNNGLSHSSSNSSTGAVSDQTKKKNKKSKKKGTNPSPSSSDSTNNTTPNESSTSPTPLSE
eukprot:TRINITY_DN1269_c0_g2_i1.p1 TRINITY_DN1269_c0_g2~~TRINITY_DN1269_c0_g2_i1.p1  ORF type:complete len:741 (+),score=156.13 TRINITY_DN1269_c0_g2_i1:149-2371(+)